MEQIESQPVINGKVTIGNKHIVDMVFDALVNKSHVNFFVSPKGKVHILSEEKYTELLTTERRKAVEEFVAWIAKGNEEDSISTFILNDMLKTYLSEADNV